jgi:hypothetical protein
MLAVDESVCIVPDFTLLGFRLIVGLLVCMTPAIMLLGLTLAVGDSVFFVLTFVSS